MLLEPPVRDIEIFIELQKGVVDKKTGRIPVRGIASDNSVDFQNDIVQISQIGNSLAVLNRGWGKFNFDHHKEVVGEITSVAFITPEQAKAKYDVDCVGTVIEIEGFVYAITDKTPPDSDVREVHKLLDAKARLGFSMQGGIGQRVPVRGKDGKQYNVAIPSFVNQVAITGQPINMNTICLPFAKSLAAVLCGGGLSGEEWAQVTGEEKLPPLLFCGDGPGMDGLIKSLTSSGSQALVGSTGGDATRTGTEDFGKNDGHLEMCSECSASVSGNDVCCPNCGSLGSEMRKALVCLTAKMFAADYFSKSRPF